MENLMEMEYVINGEKYLITVTKVEKAPTEKELNCKEDLCEDICDAGKEFPTDETIEDIKFGGDNVVMIPISMIPEGISIEDWLTIIKEYDVILTN